MLQFTLPSTWRMKAVTDTEWLPAVVPGSVYGDLLQNGRMEDPYYRDNELDCLKRSDLDYEYETTFTTPAGFEDCTEILLRFEGIDTLADILLNGKLLGKAENMHRTYEFSVKDCLLEGENLLHITLFSPTVYIAKQYAASPMNHNSDCMDGFSYLRKAHCMFGWDWGPRLPDLGIWRGISLLGIEHTSIDSVYIKQRHYTQDGTLITADTARTPDQANQVARVDLELSVSLRETVRTGNNTSQFIPYHVLLTCPDGTELAFDGSPSVISVPCPVLWWPNGYGEQPLYTVCVSLMGERIREDGITELFVTDTWQRQIGLRTATMHIAGDVYGESFCHRINGIDIFAMGADYIPEDNLFGRITAERTLRLLTEGKQAGFNMIRVWGGGCYPADDFFDSCDRLGLLVWMDFMFACAAYRLTPEFEENITAEFADNIKRIRHHASLGIWCGNNEMEIYTAPGQWFDNVHWRADYIKIFEYLIPKAVKTYDPETFYWPSSPSSGGSFDNPRDENRGDTHYWDVWHGNKPITEYRKYFYRYVSEFGFQSFPTLETVKTFTLPEDRNIFSYVMEKHQRNNVANGKIMNYMEQSYLYPTDFAVLLYASQLLQADAVRYGVEHFRRNRGRCMGATYWQLNDCWPVASWASIDYCGRRKALHYYAKRFYAPILLSCDEESTLTQDPNPNAIPYEVRKSVTFNVSNETFSDQAVTVVYSLRDNTAKILECGQHTMTVPALQAVWMDKINFPQANLYEHYVSYSLYAGTDTTVTPISHGSVLFCAPKFFRFINPNLSVRVSGDELICTATSYCRAVEIQNASEDLVLSDNYFDMDAGERRIKLLRGEAKELSKLRVRSVYDIR